MERILSLENIDGKKKETKSVDTQTSLSTDPSLPLCSHCTHDETVKPDEKVITPTKYKKDETDAGGGAPLATPETINNSSSNSTPSDQESKR